MAGSSLWLRLGKIPRAIEDFGPRAKHSHRVVPARRDRDAVGDFAVAPAELDADRAVLILFRSDAVHRIAIGRVGLEKPLAVVDGERPESVDGDIFDRQLVDGTAVVARAGTIGR